MTVFDRICLVLGGARSGKSRFAEQLAQARAGELVYLATALERDAEMAERIRLHQERRGERWRTIEVPLELAAALRASGEGSVLLVDCLTIWLANLMEAGRDLDHASEELCAAAQESRAAIVLVSSEVGQGIVPANSLGRRFRDEAGKLHQAVAAAADTVYLVTAGLPLRLKPRGDS